MTTLGYITILTLVFSIHTAYKIFIKISNKKYNYEDFLNYKKEYGEFINESIDYNSFLKMNQKKDNIVIKFIQLLFISLIVIAMNMLFVFLSHNFYWLKAYKSLSEKKYESVVVGYNIEVSYGSSFRSYSPRKILIYYPKVKFIDEAGKQIIKQGDLGTNDKNKNPIGEKLIITDKKENDFVNIIEVDWVFFIGTIFIGINSFFSSLISLYPSNLNLKQRIVKSFYFGILIFSINLACLMVLKFLQN
ncbi:hypothetical protein B0A58_02420 [Flavobacterium branchiophilum NBRC 15030 = ATCC 35035]|uniref:DUF3592 domain-containing protein n=1 Tax=Flavobacterium branchiophilum TaxID=55197 RepID=A0A543G2B9_9FLAO|nr:hypothetical protein [Flavobacterium branchiophilum]OXA80471.1 hypothetical protein B0A58_02420 [Flavobacterium branchiophilum NBRC 15030 = ATCC 35035]TQM40174.1 hypothetical protein BC670_1046 [Flavobacterium branchiophilum]GEM56117.1 hypothetical protein FB1_23380 [Flavobacterium branchiophilum NBRC 15030 = ATCC 35035]